MSGTVVYNGAPLPLGAVTFLSEENGAVAGGATIEKGAFSIPASGGLLAGRYKVSISFPDVSGGWPKDGEAPGVSREIKERLPAKYNRDTELRARVAPDDANVFSFDLK